MSVVALLVVLAALAGIYYLVNYHNGGAKIGPVFKFLMNFVLIVTAVGLVLVATGVWDAIKRIQVPRI